jgi:hypothetical protein
MFKLFLSRSENEFSRDEASDLEHLVQKIGILIKVVLTIIVWLILFWGIFIGYFTLPFLLVGLTALLYILTDFLVLHFKGRRDGSEERGKGSR